MRKIERLIREARDAATWRGHTLPRFQHTHHVSIRNTPSGASARVSWRIRAVADCRVCKMGVAVDTQPPANGIDIGGPAVAVNCPITERVTLSVYDRTLTELHISRHADADTAGRAVERIVPLISANVPHTGPLYYMIHKGLALWCREGIIETGSE